MLTDSYKVAHHLQYPPGTTRVYSYFESRGGAFEENCFFGLQSRRFAEAEACFKIHLSHPVYGYQEDLFNRKGWEQIVASMSLAMILTAMKDSGWAADNLAFGISGALLQSCTATPRSVPSSVPTPWWTGRV